MLDELAEGGIPEERVVIVMALGSHRALTRQDLLKKLGADVSSRVRVYNHPTRYVRKIYGEQEVGGTGWLYLSAVPFEQLGFRTDLGTTPYPEFTQDFLYGVPVALFGLPALLLGLNLLAQRRSEP